MIYQIFEVVLVIDRFLFSEFMVFFFMELTIVLLLKVTTSSFLELSNFFDLKQNPDFWTSQMGHFQEASFVKFQVIQGFN